MQSQLFAIVRTYLCVKQSLPLSLSHCLSFDRRRPCCAVYQQAHLPRFLVYGFVLLSVSFLFVSLSLSLPEFVCLCKAGDRECVCVRALSRVSVCDCACVFVTNSCLLY